MKFQELLKFYKTELDDMDFSESSRWAKMSGFESIKHELRIIRQKKYSPPYEKLCKYLEKYINRGNDNNNYCANYLLGVIHFQLFTNNQDKTKKGKEIEIFLKYLQRAVEIANEHKMHNELIELSTLIGYTFFSHIHEDIPNLKDRRGYFEKNSLTHNIILLSKKSLGLDNNYLPAKLLLMCAFKFLLKHGIAITTLRIDNQYDDDYETEEAYQARVTADNKLAFDCFTAGTAVDGLHPSLRKLAWKYLGHCYRRGLGIEMNAELADICDRNYNLIKRDPNIIPLPIDANSTTSTAIIVRDDRSVPIEPNLILENSELQKRVAQLERTLASFNLGSSPSQSGYCEINRCTTYLPARNIERTSEPELATQKPNFLAECRNFLSNMY